MSLSPFGTKPAEQVEHVSVDVGDPPLQIYDSSIAEQSEAQPSDGSVFPSSHTSLPALRPSPHTVSQVSLSPFGEYPSSQAVQVSAVVVVPPIQMKLSSIVVQSEEHPSESVSLLSSQTSSPALSPSPQVVTQVSLSPLGENPAVHAVQVSFPDELPPVQI